MATPASLLSVLEHHALRNGMAAIMLSPFSSFVTKASL
jgi:hypothetical protein